MKTDKLLASLDSLGWTPGLTPESYEHIARCNFRGIESFRTVAILTELVLDNQPLTVRGLMYRAVSCGLFPSTAHKFYTKTSRLCVSMRKQGIIEYRSIVDNLRSTEKPSSWSGLNDFADTVREAYRKDFWASLDSYCHVICEKDAVAGTLSPVTREFDVPLSPIRGYISDSFAFELGDQWRRIDKPITVLYLGDYDPSGFDLERSTREKICNHAGKDVCWKRLGVNLPDFWNFNLIKLAPKKSDTRCKRFLEGRGEDCAEVDALPPPELRKRLRNHIEQLIDKSKWEALKRVEAMEQEALKDSIGSLKAYATDASVLECPTWAR